MIRIHHQSKGNLEKVFDFVLSRNSCCGRKYEVKKIHAGHFMSRRPYSTRGDEDNVRPQCYGCNVGNQGRNYEFGLNLNKEEEGKADRLLNKSRELVKFSTGDIEMLIANYQDKLKQLE